MVSAQASSCVTAMPYWILLTNEANWKVIKKKNIWGLPKARKDMIQRVKEGDEAFMYLMQEVRKEGTIPSRIVGLFEVISDPYTSSERIFTDRSYPNRVNLSPKIVLERNYLEFKGLIPRLEFIKNKTYWSGHLRSGLAKIPKEDYELLKSELASLT